MSVTVNQSLIFIYDISLVIIQFVNNPNYPNLITGPSLLWEMSTVLIRTTIS